MGSFVSSGGWGKKSKVKRETKKGLQRRDGGKPYARGLHPAPLHRLRLQPRSDYQLCLPPAAATASYCCMEAEREPSAIINWWSRSSKEALVDRPGSCSWLVVMPSASAMRCNSTATSMLPLSE